MKARPFLGYGKQSIDETDIAAVVEVLRGDYLTQGPAVEKFEKALAEYVGAKHAIAVSNGTAGLHLACLASGLVPGELALTSTLTFVASANAPIYCGAACDLLDIDRNTLCMDGVGLTAALSTTPAARAVIPVHFAGLAHDSEHLKEVVGSRTIIEDACHSLGGQYSDGRMIGCGAHADMTVFSFHPVKPITTGEGGAIVTNDDEFARRLRLLRSHGIERNPQLFIDTPETERGPWSYEQQCLAFNYRMTDLQAALGLSQLARLEGFIRRRRQIAAYYDERLANLPGMTRPQSSPEQRRRSGQHIYVVEIDWDAVGISRKDMIGRLQDVGIGSQVHYIPVHKQPFHARRVVRTEFPAADQYYHRALTIPLFPGMTDEDVEYVVRELTAILTKGQ